MKEPKDEILEAAVRMSEMGLAVHWLRPPIGGNPEGRGKAPIDKGWQNRPRLFPDQLRQRYRAGYNVGLHTGIVFGARVMLVVVDCDSPEATQWCRVHLPPTPMQARTSTGYHLYYRRLPMLEHVPNRVRVDGVALDLRADGGNVVAPPSLHPSGAIYQWVEPMDHQTLANLPVYRPEWFPRPAAPASSPVIPPIGAQHAEPYQRACAYARSTPGAVAGQGGSLATFKLAVALVRGFALPEEQALAVLQQEYNARCEPPWSEPELRHKVRCAAEAGRVALGSLLGAGR